MVTMDIESVQQILQKKVTFGHTKRHLKKQQNRLLYIDMNKNFFFFTLTY